MCTSAPGTPLPTLRQIQSLLQTFTKSTAQFKLIHSIPVAQAVQHSKPPILGQSQSQSQAISALLILDSSYNPPTKAHAYLIQRAIERAGRCQVGRGRRDPDRTSSDDQGKPRVLLLLSTKNADKASAPASIEQRVFMMGLFAKEIWNGLAGSSASGDPSGTGQADADADEKDATAPISGIDIAVTTEPLFVEKSIFLSRSSEDNPYAETPDIPQWHLLGYDTLVRLLDPKYYPPSGSLGVLKPIFKPEGNRVLVVRRDEGSKSTSNDEDGNEQDDFVKHLRREKSEDGFDVEGWNTEWGSKVELVDAFDGIRDEKADVISVSSTSVRKAAQEGDEKLVRQICGDAVGRYVLDEKLYLED